MLFSLEGWEKKNKPWEISILYDYSVDFLLPLPSHKNKSRFN